MIFMRSLQDSRWDKVKQMQLSKWNRERAWRSCESTCLLPMWSGFDSRTRRRMWVDFVVGSRPCSEGFFSASSGFSFLLKNQHARIPIRSRIRRPQVCQLKNCLLSPSLNKVDLFSNRIESNIFGPLLSIRSLLVYPLKFGIVPWEDTIMIFGVECAYPSTVVLNVSLVNIYPGCQNLFSRQRSNTRKL